MMKTTNLIETDSLRIRQVNSVTEKLGLPTRLISIKTGASCASADNQRLRQFLELYIYRELARILT
jgi:hypothetical protein